MVYHAVGKREESKKGNAANQQNISGETVGAPRMLMIFRIDHLCYNPPEIRNSEGTQLEYHFCPGKRLNFDAHAKEVSIRSSQSILNFIVF